MYSDARQEKVVASLKRYADHHARRAVIQTYIAESTAPLAREKAAYALSEDFKGYARLGDEEGLIWACVARTARPEALRVHRIFLAENSPALVPMFDGLAIYQASCQAAAKAYTDLLAHEASLKRSLDLPATATLTDKQVTDALKDARSAMYEAMAVRNEAAYDVAKQHQCLRQWAASSPEQLTGVYPRMDGKKFLRHIALHEARLAAEERVKCFVALHAANPAATAEKMALAYDMTTHHMAKHYSPLARHKIDRGRIWQLALGHRYCLENAAYAGEDKVIHRALADYVLANEKTRLAWQAVRLGERRGKGISKQTAFDLSASRNRLAYQVCEALGRSPETRVFEPFVAAPLTKFPLELPRLINHAKQSSRVGPHGTDPLTPRYVRCRIPRFQTGV